MSGEWFTQTNTVGMTYTSSTVTQTNTITVEPQCVQPIDFTQTNTIAVEPQCIPPLEVPPTWREWLKDVAGKTVLVLSVGAVVYDFKGGRFPIQPAPSREVQGVIQSVINTISPPVLRVSVADIEQHE